MVQPLPPHREMVLSTYAYEFGVPLPEFLLRLHLCKKDEALAHILAGEFRLDGEVLQEPEQIIRLGDLRVGSVAELGDQRVTLGFWSDEPGQDPEPQPPPPNASATLEIRSFQRWEAFNDYEGHCTALWHGREDCFHLLLVGDEWDAIRIGATWRADIVFECGSPVEVTETVPGMPPGLQPIEGINHAICGRILRFEGDLVWLDLPWPLTVDLDRSRRVGDELKAGRWLQAQGSIEARIPEKP